MAEGEACKVCYKLGALTAALAARDPGLSGEEESHPTNCWSYYIWRGRAWVPSVDGMSLDRASRLG
jgi:hypothetical protein